MFFVGFFKGVGFRVELRVGALGYRFQDVALAVEGVGLLRGYVKVVRA